MLPEFVLLNPGPANTTASVRKALLVPDICHREPEFYNILRSVRRKLVAVAGGGDEFAAVVLTGSGTAAVETAVSSLVRPDGKLLIAENGAYGERIRRMAEAHGIPFALIRKPVTEAFTPADIETALAKDASITHVAVVHHETTAGVLNPVAKIGRVTSRRGKILIVDSMSAFAGEPLHVRRDRVDCVISSSNKCVQALPGLSFIIARRKVLEALGGHPPRSVYLDLFSHWTSQEKDSPLFTPSVPLFFALDTALRELLDEGLAARCRRYRDSAMLLRSGMAKLGFHPLVAPRIRTNTMTCFPLPPGVSYEELHDALRARGFIVYAGTGSLSKTAFRVANMGTIGRREIQRFLAALRGILKEMSRKRRGDRVINADD
ncbi:MAG: 2-aminoethylphosphonate--pyruvate transaminase [Planctomycetota bacterium]